MDRRSHSTRSKEFFLRVPQIQHQVRQQIAPVILEHRCLRMVDHPTTGQTTTTTATTTATTATFTSTSASTSISTPIIHRRPTTATGTATTSSIQRPVTAATTAPSPTCKRKDEIIPPRTTTSTSSSPLLVPRTSATSSPTLTPKLPSPVIALRGATAIATVVTSAGDGDSAPTGIVGGKHPVVEESPQIVLSQPSNGEGEDDERGQQQHKQKQHQQLSEVPESERSRSRKLLHSATTTSKLSTREHAQTRDQPYRERSHSEGRPSVHFTLAPAKRDEAHIMEFFQEQEKNLQESFLSLPKKTSKKQRSPSPRVQQNAGLEHLDNLVRLMQQLTSLKDENVQLRKRCDFLESTKILLEAKRELSPEGDASPSGFTTLTAKQKHHTHPHSHHHHKAVTKSRQATTFPAAMRDGRNIRPRLSSAEEFQLLEAATSSSDQRTKAAKKAMHKRSFSTGSLEVPLDMLRDEEDMTKADGKSIKAKDAGLKSSSKQKTKSSKWARVKKVLTGQKLYEDLGTTIRSLRDFGRSSQMRYSTTNSGIMTTDVTTSMSHSSSMEAPSYAVGQTGEASGRMTPPTLTKPSAEQTSITEESDSELTTDIWMGPEEWWEEYEASKHSAASLSSDVSSVIEVTTMYLGAKKDVMSTSQTTTTSATSTSSTASTTHEKQQQLELESYLSMRRPSPSLSLEDAEDDASLLEECATKTEPVRLLHKSSSCKSADLDIPKEPLFESKGADGKEAKKSHRTAWHRVKDIIIHTRKDSMKRKTRKEKTGGLLTEPEESSEIDMEAFLDDQWGSEFFAEGLLSRSTPKTSPMVLRQQQPSSKSIDVTPSSKVTGATSKSGPSTGTFPPGASGTVDMAALLGRSMSEDFNKKMQEWEEMKSRKSSTFRASIEESDVGSLDVSHSSQDFPLRTVDLKDIGGKIPEATSESLTTEDSNTSTETMGGPHTHMQMEGMPKKMTDSFSRKMLEWEKRKYKGSPVPLREMSPDIERKGSKGRKEERQKSKRSKEDKEKEKIERQREREMQKVEKEQVKLEKEKLRIEKERLRALEREAKLEKLKGRLSHSESDGSFRNPILSPLAEYKVTADFARKLHEWELRKGLSHDMSNSMYLEAQKMKMHQLREEPPTDSSRPGSSPRFSYDRGGEGAEGGGKSPPSPLNLQPFWDSPEDTSPIEKCSDPSQGEDTTDVTEEYRTTANIPSLERANAQLLQELRKKEAEYSAVQDEVQDLNSRLTKVRQDHASEMARYHRDIALGSDVEPVKLEVSELERSMVDLEEKIKVMENMGEKMAVSMESAAVGKWQSIEGEETVHTQLVGLVGQMRSMLVQATQSEEASQKTSALSNFETLYSQAMKLQVEMNNLRLSHLERNREIMVIKRQLLLQEVNNLLLQADITRRETELYQFQEAKRFSSLKKWNTFGGSDRQRPHAQIELPTPILVTAQSKSNGSKVPSKENSVELLSERVSVPETTKSAPSSPQTKFNEDADLLTSSPTINGQSHSDVDRLSDQSSTDHRESHLISPTLARRQKDSLLQQRTDEARIEKVSPGTRIRDTGPTTSLRLPTLSRGTRLPDTEISPVMARKQIVPDSKVVGEVGKEERSSADILSSLAVVEIPERTTSYDSEPIHRELEALRRARRKVGKGSPTLIEKKNQDLAPVPSPGEGRGRLESTPETPDQSIPKQPLHSGKPKPQRAASLMDDNISPSAQSVIDCTDLPSISDQTQMTHTATHNTEEDDVLLLSTQAASPTSSVPLSTLPPISDQARGGSRSPRSPVSKQKLLRRQQKDERDTKIKDYSAVSPKGSPIAARGKPPLPRQNTPVRQSPSSSPSNSEKGTRSKSHGDVDTMAPSSPTIKPLQETINKFEKRATVCESEDRPIELRKTPSPTLHLPRVGLVSRVRKLKPAAELLEESQRYRSGQSIYATRILQKYLPKEDSKSDSQKISHNKENVSGSYVHAIVQRLSRETTPVRSGASSRTNSDGSLHYPDSPRTQSEFVSHIVKKLSPSSGLDGTQPFNDRTNDDQQTKDANVYNGQVEHPKSEVIQPETKYVQHRIPSSADATTLQHRKSCEVAEVLASSSLPMTESSFSKTSSMSTGAVAAGDDQTYPMDSPTNHKSLPSIPTSTSQKTATANLSDKERRKQSEEESTEIESEFSSHTSASPVVSKTREKDVKVRGKGKGEGKSAKVKGEGRRFPSSLSPIRRVGEKGEKQTVGTLCKQSISFDLGVSMHAREEAASVDVTSSKSRKPRSWDPSESTAMEAARGLAAEISATTTTTTTVTTTTTDAPASIEVTEGGEISGGAESEVASPPSSPPPSGEKRRPRRFLDANWIQRSKRFFKVNK